MMAGLAVWEKKVDSADKYTGAVDLTRGQT